ncbi:MAG: pilin [Minisyncoccales bacterium]
MASRWVNKTKKTLVIEFFSASFLFFLFFWLFFSLVPQRDFSQKAFAAERTFSVEGCQSVCKSCKSDADCGNNCKCIGAQQDKGVPGECQPKLSIYICPLTKHEDIKSFINEINNWIFYLALATAPLLFIVGAFYIFTSAGETGRIKKGKQIIIWTIIGLGVILFAKASISIMMSILS